MTFALFIIAFIIFFFAALNLLPTASVLPTDFVDGFTLIVSNMKAWDAIFPITELLTAVSILASFYLFKYLVKVIKWVIGVVRGTGTQ